MAIERTRQAYGQRAQEYISRLGSIDATASPDCDLISTWAHKQPNGPILDVGCGPGHWTNWLHEQGIDIGGIDPTSEFVGDAQERFPNIRFREGLAEQLDVADSSLAGILAWYSMIHMQPDRITDAFTEFSRTIKPGGGLLVGFFDGPEIKPFDHAITTAYFWPIDRLSCTIEQAGFDVTVRDTRVDPGVRPHGAIMAHRLD